MTFLLKGWANWVRAFFGAAKTKAFDKSKSPVRIEQFIFLGTDDGTESDKSSVVYIRKQLTDVQTKSE